MKDQFFIDYDETVLIHRKSKTNPVPMFQVCFKFTINCQNSKGANATRRRRIRRCLRGQELGSQRIWRQKSCFEIGKIWRTTSSEFGLIIFCVFKNVLLEIFYSIKPSTVENWVQNLHKIAQQKKHKTGPLRVLPPISERSRTCIQVSTKFWN